MAPRLQNAISLVAGSAEFTAGDWGLVTRDNPAARIGVMLNAARSMNELVGTGLLHVLPGAVPSGQHLDDAIADRNGRAASDIARAALVRPCGYTLHLSDFEPILSTL